MGRLNYVFFGTPDFAATILEKLIKAGFAPAALVCNPDRPVGRKKIITPPPTKVVADKYGISVFQPESLKNFQFGERRFDFGVVASYAKIIPKNIIGTFRLGIIGVHPSLLPRHRGASPIQSAILTGDEITGVTLYLLDEKTDHGAILAGRELTITNDDNYDTLSRKLAELGAELAAETIPDYLGGKIKPQVQNEEYATYTGKFETEDGHVNLEKDNPIAIERKVRALNPEPGVWTMKEGKRMKILEAELNPATAGGKLRLKRIQFEGKKPQTL